VYCADVRSAVFDLRAGASKSQKCNKPSTNELNHIVSYVQSPKILTTAAGGIMFGALPAIPALTDEASLQARIKAIAFDAFPIFDPRPSLPLSKDCTQARALH
jgi:hypothetical protein